MTLRNRIDYLDHVQRACETLLKIPGVVSAGLGSKITAGKNARELSLSVMVLEKKSQRALSPEEIIPGEIEGLPTVVVEGHPPRVIQDADKDEDFDTGFPLDTDTYRPVVGGRSKTRNGAPTFGTLGCFAKTTSKDAGQRGFPTNQHMLADDFDDWHGPSCKGCTKGDNVGDPCAWRCKRRGFCLPGRCSGVARP